MSGTTNYTISLNALASYSGNNAPDFLLLVDGQQVGSGVVSSYNPETETFSVPITPGQQHTISIVYTNFTTSGQLLNLLSIGINGQTIASSASNEDYVSSHGTVASTGQMVYGGQVNFVVPASYFPAPAGTTPVTPPVTPAPTEIIGSGPDTLALSLSEDAYQGDAQFTVSVDGVQQGGTQTVTASHAAGQTQTFDIEGTYINTTHTVTVDFLNDAYGGSATTDRNLYVTAAAIDGHAVAGAVLNEFSAGSQSFTFTGTTAPPTPPAPTGPVTVGSGPDTLALSVSEDAYQGNAQFTVSVDGVQQGGTLTATASHAAGQSQIFDIEGTYGSGSHTVTVNFLNDAYGGSAATDRNLYVTSATIDGQAVPGAVLNEPTSGPMSFTFAGKGSAPPPASSAFYVSATGSNSGDGSAAHPFATLQYALTQMEKDAIHTLYVGSGTYAEASAVTLTAADNGDSILAAAGATPVLNATGGNNTIISLAGAQNVTVSGLTLENAAYYSQTGALFLSGSDGDTISGNTFVGNGEAAMFAAASSNDTFTKNQVDNSTSSGVEVKDGSNSDVFSDNTVNGVGAVGVSGAAFFGHGISNDVFENNLVENTAGAGIAIEDYGQGITLNDANTITENDILNTSTSTASTDDGAIYLLGRSDNNLQTTISMNFISGSGNVNSNAHVEGIYLDDNASGVSVTGNIVQGIQDDATELHGGYDDTFTNNIFNLGASTRTAALIQQPEPNEPATVQAALTGDKYTDNIVTSQQPMPYYTYVYYDPEPISVAISNNLYWDPAIPQGGLPDTYGIYFNPNTPAGGLPMVAPVTDSKPVVGNPDFVTSASGSYGIGSGSAATQIGFVPINQALIGPH